jgi:DNA-binding Lrp family transcriptional regulator
MDAPEHASAESAPALDPIDRRLLDDYQRGFPLVPRPYRALAAALGIDEDDVLARLARLKATGRIDRIGAVIRPHTLGVSTLAAIAVPEDRLDDVATLVAARPEVNHCYAREHAINLWFVAVAADGPALARCLAAIARETGLPILDLPLEDGYHIDLGFALR